MKRYFLLAFVLAAGLTVFLMSGAAAQVTQIKTSLPSVSKVVSPRSIEPYLNSRMSPASDSASVIAATSAFTTYLPLIVKAASPCSVAPTLISPANGSNLNTLIPTLQWNGGNDSAATTLVLEAAKDTSFTQIELSLWSTPTGVGQWQWYWNLNPGTTYYWRAHLECGTSLKSPYSTVWSFVTGSGGTILPAPSLISPPNGSTTSSPSVTFQWSAVSGATQYVFQRKQVGTTTTYLSRVTGTQTIRSLNPNATYQWSVSAQNDYAIGSASATWQFTTPAASSPNSLEKSSHTFVVSDGVNTIVEESDNK